MQKTIIALLVVLFIGGGAFLFWKQRQSAESQTAAAVDVAAPPAQDSSEAMNEEGANEPWGVILFDHVKVMDTAESAKTGVGGQEVDELNTGDAIDLDTEQKVDGALALVTAKGLHGFVAAKQAMRFNANSTPRYMLYGTQANYSIFDQASIRKNEGYSILSSKEFLMRAAKNPNQEVAQWAQLMISEGRVIVRPPGEAEKSSEQ
jgi:hypothetical protein